MLSQNNLGGIVPSKRYTEPAFSAPVLSLGVPIMISPLGVDAADLLYSDIKN